MEIQNTKHAAAGFTLSTAMGNLRITWSPRGICSLDLGLPDSGGEAEAPAWVREAGRLITRHLAGDSVDLRSLPLDLEGLPAFHRRVYEALRRTQPGETVTYGHLALLAGSPGAAQAVGQALKRNPLPILVPCHRVLAANGLGGFSLLGGLKSKLLLLALEGVHPR